MKFNSENYLKPKSDFGCIRACIIDQKIKFSADSNMYINKFFWDFGDGETAETRYYEKSYSSPGNYNVSLTVFNKYGSTVISKTNCISVHAPIIVDFEADLTSGIAPLTVKFKSTSKGEIQDYVWGFGDGGESKEKLPVYTYISPGIYDVQLEVYDVPDINKFSLHFWKIIDRYIKVLDPLDVDDSKLPKQKFKILQVLNNKIIIDFGSLDIAPNSLIIYDLMGNVIFKADNNTLQTKSNIGSFEFTTKLVPGIYFIKLMINNQIYTDKFFYVN